MIWTQIGHAYIGCSLQVQDLLEFSSASGTFGPLLGLTMNSKRSFTSVIWDKPAIGLGSSNNACIIFFNTDSTVLTSSRSRVHCYAAVCRWTRTTSLMSSDLEMSHFVVCSWDHVSLGNNLFASAALLLFGTAGPKYCVCCNKRFLDLMTVEKIVASTHANC